MKDLFIYSVGEELTWDHMNTTWREHTKHSHPPKNTGSRTMIQPFEYSFPFFLSLTNQHQCFFQGKFVQRSRKIRSETVWSCYYGGVMDWYWVKWNVCHNLHIQRHCLLWTLFCSCCFLFPNVGTLQFVTVRFETMYVPNSNLSFPPPVYEWISYVYLYSCDNVKQK